MLTVIFSHCFEDIMLSSDFFFFGGGGGVGGGIETCCQSSCHSFIIPFKKSLITIILRSMFGVLRVQQNSFWCVFLSYSSLLCFLSLRSHVFCQMWETLGHFEKFLVSLSLW